MFRPLLAILTVLAGMPAPPAPHAPAASPPPPSATSAPAPTPSAGEPLRPAWLPADTAWVVHLDLEALRLGPLGELWSVEEIQRSLEEIEDPEQREIWRRSRPLLEQTRSMTISGSSYDAVRGTLMVRTEAGEEEFFSAVAAHGAPASVMKEEGRTLRVWKAADGPVYVSTDAAAKAGGVLTIVASQSREDLDARIALLSGEGPSLQDASGPFAEACRPREGTILLIVMTDLAPLRKHERAAMILKHAELLRLEIGAHADEAFAELSILSPSEETARQMGDIARGLLAMGQMVLGQEAWMAGPRDLLSKVSVQTEAQTTRISLKCPAAHLISAVEAARQDRPRVKRMKEPESDAKNRDAAQDKDRGKEPAPR